MKEIDIQRMKGRILSAVIAILCMMLSIFAVKAGKEESFSLGDFRGISVQEAEKAYRDSGEADDLVYLLKVLCYQAEVEKNADVKDMIAEYGTKLLDMAKAEEINLKEMDDEEETLLELLRLIREYGAS